MRFWINFTQKINLSARGVKSRVAAASSWQTKDRSELDEIIGQDPFFKNGIAKYEITEFSPTKFVPGFERLLGE